MKRGCDLLILFLKARSKDRSLRQLLGNFGDSFYLPLLSICPSGTRFWMTPDRTIDMVRNPTPPLSTSRSISALFSKVYRRDKQVL